MNISDLDKEELEYFLSNANIDELREAIRSLCRENDELKGIQRSPDGELIISGDESYHDEEEIVH